MRHMDEEYVETRVAIAYRHGREQGVIAGYEKRCRRVLTSKAAYKEGYKDGSYIAEARVTQQFFEEAIKVVEAAGIPSMCRDRVIALMNERIGTKSLAPVIFRKEETAT
jgi:hypothetical protein